MTRVRRLRLPRPGPRELCAACGEPIVAGRHADFVCRFYIGIDDESGMAIRVARFFHRECKPEGEVFG